MEEEGEAERERERETSKQQISNPIPPKGSYPTPLANSLLPKSLIGDDSASACATEP